PNVAQPRLRSSNLSPHAEERSPAVSFTGPASSATPERSQSRRQECPCDRPRPLHAYCVGQTERGRKYCRRLSGSDHCRPTPGRGSNREILADIDVIECRFFITPAGGNLCLRLGDAPGNLRASTQKFGRMRGCQRDDRCEALAPRTEAERRITTQAH